MEHKEFKGRHFNAENYTPREIAYRPFKGIEEEEKGILTIHA